MSKKIFLAGSNNELTAKETKDLFDTRTKKLEAEGHSVFHCSNQAWSAMLENAHYSDKMKVTIPVMLQCDELHLLHNWAKSRGAIMLRTIALSLEIPIINH